jgi:hypothetical protein
MNFSIIDSNDIPERSRRHREAHAADAGRQPADPPKQYKPNYFGDSQTPDRQVISEKALGVVILAGIQLKFIGSTEQRGHFLI